MASGLSVSVPEVGLEAGMLETFFALNRREWNKTGLKRPTNAEGAGVKSSSSEI